MKVILKPREELIKYWKKAKKDNRSRSAMIVDVLEINATYFGLIFGEIYDAEQAHQEDTIKIGEWHYNRNSFITLKEKHTREFNEEVDKWLK